MRYGIRNIIITSMGLISDPKLAILGSQLSPSSSATSEASAHSPMSDITAERFRIVVPKVDATFSGTGDLFSALLLAHAVSPDFTALEKASLQFIAQRTVALVQHIIAETMKVEAEEEAGGVAPATPIKELRLIECRHVMRTPQEPMGECTTWTSAVSLLPEDA